MHKGKAPDGPIEPPPSGTGISSHQRFDSVPGADLVITARVGEFLRILDEAEPEWLAGYAAVKRRDAFAEAAEWAIEQRQKWQGSPFRESDIEHQAKYDAYDHMADVFEARAKGE